MGSQEMNIVFNEYNYALQASLQESLQSELFSDVMLVADGGVIKAHKLILSVMSPYLREMFERCPAGAQYAYVVLPDVNCADLAALVQFIYSGKVSGSRDRLAAMQTIANMLRIRAFSKALETYSLVDGSVSDVTDASESSPLPAFASVTANLEDTSYDQSPTPPRNKRKRRRSSLQPVVAHLPSGLTVIPISTTKSSVGDPHNESDDSSDSIAEVKAEPRSLLADYSGTEYATSEGGADYHDQEYYSSNSQMDNPHSEENSLGYYEQENNGIGADSKHLRLSTGEEEDTGGGNTALDSLVFASTSTDSLQNSVAQQDMAVDLSVSVRRCGHYRMPYSSFQISELEKQYEQSPYLTGHRRFELAARIGLTERQIKIWFQNRRMKAKKIHQDTNEAPSSAAATT